MNRKNVFALALIAALGLVGVAGSIAVAVSAGDAESAGQPEMNLPPGWTEADMQACMLAGTPGEMHAHLASDAGVWHGKTTMWMAPDTEPITSTCTSTLEPMMDGRYMRHEMSGDMPGMGPYSGLGICGYDNVSKEFVSVWVDNQSTGIMYGVGKLSPDGKTLRWEFTFNCPLTGKPTPMREIETSAGPDTKTLEMFGTDPKSGKEYKMMHIDLTRKAAAGPS